MKKIIYNQLLKDITKFFLLSSLSLSLIIWVIQAVNYLGFGGLSLFSSSSDMQSPTDSDYVNLAKGIDYLLYAGGISKDEDPTSQKRENVFGPTENQEIEMFRLF